MNRMKKIRGASKEIDRVTFEKERQTTRCTIYIEERYLPYMTHKQRRTEREKESFEHTTYRYCRNKSSLYYMCYFFSICLSFYTFNFGKAMKILLNRRFLLLNYDAVLRSYASFPFYSWILVWQQLLLSLLLSISISIPFVCSSSLSPSFQHPLVNCSLLLYSSTHCVNSILASIVRPVS